MFHYETPKPAVSQLSRRGTLLTLLTLLALPVSLEAQAPRSGGGGRGAMKMPDPILFNGPPTPEDFLDLVGLDSAQYDGYRQHYTSYMEATRPQRDSLIEARRRVREAMARGDYTTGMYGGDRDNGAKLQKTMAEVAKRQAVFDEELKAILRQPQVERYTAWRKEEYARAERQMRERFGDPR